MKLKESYAQPGYLFRRVHQIATAAFMIETKESNLTPVQFAALLAIQDNPSIDATRVSDLISFDRTTIGHVLTRLEEKKLITRRAGTADKRTKLIQITLAGQARIRRVQTVVPRVADRILGSLSRSDRVTLLRLLEAVVEASSGSSGARLRSAL